MAEADECPQICPANYSPICGKNGNGQRQTFSNSCAMQAKNCNKKGGDVYVVEKNGEC